MSVDRASTPRTRRYLCVPLHDVAPCTLRECRKTLAFLDALRVGPVALLVVPDYHGQGRVDRDGQFCEFLRARARRGDEIVLHGYLHRDSGGVPCGLGERLERRVYTDGEGEFARLGTKVARARLLRGLAVLRSAGWQPGGFVAPAWLMSPGTRMALEGLPLKYDATRDHVYLLDGERRIAAPSLVVSTRGAWRRALSIPWNCALLGWHCESPVVRAALHPRDLRFGSIEWLWRRLLGQLAAREVVTEGELVAAL